MALFKILTLSLALTVAGVAAASFKDICLSSHNKLRALHKATAKLQWDSSIAAAAQKWAEELVATDAFNHDGARGDVGENLYSQTGPTKASCAEAALSWYDERKHYNYENPNYGSNYTIGHFTQLVWKSSQKVGVGIASKTTGGNTRTVIVARYSPAGNVQITEEYKANVMQPNNPNEKPPSKFDLDPSLCSNAAGDATCSDYHSWGFCNPSNPYYKYMDSYCAKTCNLCK